MTIERELDYRQESRGFLRYARYYGKLLAVAWQTLNTDHQMRSRKTALAERFFSTTHSAQQLIDFALRDELSTKELAGIGMQTVVMKEGGSVVKKSFDAFGQTGPIMRYEIDRINRCDSLLGDHVGDLWVPVEVSIGELHLLPLPSLQSVTIRQDYIPHRWDVFHAPASVVNTDAFQQDVDLLIRAASYLSARDRFIDLVGPNNIVVQDGTNHLKIVDTVMLPLFSLDHVSETDGETARQRFNQNLELLQKLRR